MEISLESFNTAKNFNAAKPSSSQQPIEPDSDKQKNVISEYAFMELKKNQIMAEMEKVEEPLPPSPDDDNPMAWSEALKQGYKNLPRSLKEEIDPYLHPIDSTIGVGQFAAAALGPTAKEMQRARTGRGSNPYSMISGGYGLDFNEETDFEPEEFSESHPVMSSIYQMAKEKYGGIENFKRTIAQRPASIITDLAAILAPTAKMAGLSKVSKVASMAEPTAIATWAAKKAATKLIPKKLPAYLYNKAAKFSSVLNKAEREAVIKTALKHEILPTYDGIEKVQNMIDNLNSEINTVVNQATREGKFTPIASFFKKFDGMMEKITVSPVSDANAIKAVRDQFMEGYTGRNKIIFTPDEIQALKKDIYQRINTAYGKGKYSSPEVSSYKEIARSSREQLETIAPGIKELNANEADLIKLNNAIQAAAGRIENAELFGIGVPIRASMGGAIAGPTGRAIGASYALLDTPKVRARLAIVLNKMKNKNIQVDTNGVLFKLGIMKINEYGKIAPGDDIDPTQSNKPVIKGF